MSITIELTIGTAASLISNMINVSSSSIPYGDGGKLVDSGLKVLKTENYVGITDDSGRNVVGRDTVIGIVLGNTTDNLEIHANTASEYALNSHSVIVGGHTVKSLDLNGWNSTLNAPTSNTLGGVPSVGVSDFGVTAAYRDKGKLTLDSSKARLDLGTVDKYIEVTSSEIHLFNGNPYTGQGGGVTITGSYSQLGVRPDYGDVKLYGSSVYVQGTNFQFTQIGGNTIPIDITSSSLTLISPTMSAQGPVAFRMGSSVKLDFGAAPHSNRLMFDSSLSRFGKDDDRNYIYFDNAAMYISSDSRIALEHSSSSVKVGNIYEATLIQGSSLNVSPNASFLGDVEIQGQTTLEAAVETASSFTGTVLVRDSSFFAIKTMSKAEFKTWLNA